MVCSNASISNASSPAWFGEFLFETNATAWFHYIIGKKNNDFAENMFYNVTVWKNEKFMYSHQKMFRERLNVNHYTRGLRAYAVDFTEFL